jgi:hypothetical protein
MQRFKRNRIVATIRTHRSLLAIQLLFLILATLYNVSLPIYEAPDEHGHLIYANWLAEGRGLPDLERDLGQTSHEIGQPPLYYALLAPFVAPINTDDLMTIAPGNPYFWEDDDVIANYHTPAEHFPYRGTALAVHLARFLSTLMATVTIAATYGLARLIIPKQAAVAAALVAFNPQFVFISGAINNDTLVTALSALTLLVLVWIVMSDGAKRWHYLLLGASWGLAALAKVSALGLGLVIVIGLFLKFRRRHLWSEFIRMGLAVALGLAAVAGWWLLRNWLQYGHPLAWPQFLAANRFLLRAELLSWLETLDYATFLLKSYWAMFGYGIHAPQLFYLLVYALMLLAVVGLFLWLALKRYRSMSHRQLAAIALLALWSLIAFVSLMSWMRQAEATNQGRLLFPAISSLAVLMALGLANLGRRWPGRALVALLAAWSAALLIVTIRPAYEQPEPLPSSAEIPNPVDVRFGQDIKLLGYEMEETIVAPGEAPELTLYWSAAQPIAESYSVLLRAIDPAGQQIAELDTIPYQGRYRTPEWRPEQVFADTYRLPPLHSQGEPERASVIVSLYPVGRRNEALPVNLAEGSIGDTFTIAHFKVAASETQPLSPEQPADTTFDQRFRLFGYDLPDDIRAGQPFTATLYWEALVPDGQDYTVFVHLYDESGQLVAQADSPPQNNNYPTSFWSAGERIADAHQFDGLAEATPGNYRLVVGLYDPVSGRRMAAYRAGGQQWPDDSVSIDFEWGP